MRNIKTMMRYVRIIAGCAAGTAAGIALLSFAAQAPTLHQVSHDGINYWYTADLTDSRPETVLPLKNGTAYIRKDFGRPAHVALASITVEGDGADSTDSMEIAAFASADGHTWHPIRSTDRRRTGEGSTALDLSTRTRFVELRIKGAGKVSETAIHLRD
jgi:hypothetical protein